MSTLMSRQFFPLSFSDFSCCYIGHIFDSLMDQISRSGGRLNGLKCTKQQQSAEESAEGIQSSLFFYAILILASSDECRLRDLQGISHNKKWAFFDKKNKKECWQKTSGAVQRVSGRRKKPGGEKGTKKNMKREQKISFSLCLSCLGVGVLMFAECMRR